MPVATLPRSEVHLLLARPEALEDEAWVDRHRALLTEAERARCERFRHAHLRHAALVTRALVRLTLSRYAPVPPEAWRFGVGGHGKPFIEGETHGLSFNVAHTRGLVLCAVASERVLGVDVEHTAVRAEPHALAEQFFAEAEVEALRPLVGDELRERFLAIWTLKEAYAKARGLGLSLPLARYGFSLANDGSASLWLDERERLGVEPHPWHFERRAIGHHRLAVAAALARADERLEVRIVDAFAPGGSGL